MFKCQASQFKRLTSTGWWRVSLNSTLTKHFKDQYLLEDQQRVTELSCQYQLSYSKVTQSFALPPSRLPKLLSCSLTSHRTTFSPKPKGRFKGAIFTVSSKHWLLTRLIATHLLLTKQYPIFTNKCRWNNLSPICNYPLPVSIVRISSTGPRMDLRNLSSVLDSHLSNYRSSKMST